ncbi:MAG: YfiR family protein [Bacteroidales bacterium]|nr:YfiR family protein [Bacteroidales bacterium]
MRVKLVLILLFFLLPAGKFATGQMDVNNAQAIFIYNFLSQTQWPEGSIGENLIIGVLGTTPTTAHLKKITDQRKIGTKSVVVVQFSNSKELTNCHLLFIASNKSSEMAAVQQKLNGKSCLIVGEKTGLTNSGAGIDFAIIDGKLRYKINEQNIKSQNLFLSSQLVQMAMK